MPPKAAAGAAKPGLSQDEFLAACFKCAKEKITIDYDQLSKMTGMSKGGAQNKYRDMMKALGVITPNDSAVSTPDGKSTAGKRKTPAKTTTDDEEVNGDASETESPTKKPRASATKKGTAKPVKKGSKKNAAKSEPTVNNEDIDGEEDAEEGSDGIKGEGIDD